MTDGDATVRNDESQNPGGLSEELLQQEIEKALGDMSLMDMEDRPAQRRQAGGEDLRTGTVVSIVGEDILMDMGGKSTGVLSIKQLGDEPVPAVGDSVEVVVTGYNQDEGLLLLSRQGAVMAASWDTLAVGQDVEGRVTGHNKGGLELTVDGIDAFLPVSQIDRTRIDSDDLPDYVNQKMRCQITEVRRSEKSLILSRRIVLDAEAEVARKEQLATLVEGKVVTGTVKTIMPYGAFVDIGGVDGLLHIGDMGFERIEDPRKVVREGQKLELLVLKIDRETEKIGLGLKQLLADPWADAESKWPVDTVVSGRVTRLMDFGAFCELEAGVEGLIPISEMSFEKRINHPSEVVSENEVVKVRVMRVELDRKRISLSIKRLQDDPWIGAGVRWPVDSVAEGTVTRITDFGAFVELARGVEGLVHISELSAARVNSVTDVVKQGEKIQAKVVSVDEERRRIGLSIKQITASPDYTGIEAAEAEAAKPKPKRKKPLRGGLE
ncbi:MAG: S1 RNA-binding domain-containing protein [Planctomycetes bacterium]|nr:S1 RNA-binding domain-containing protein [Planctomycetota bacterium]MCH8964814.1 S1 RNA-binding domain-containing protein [Planctomycetota bacterium]MCH8970261.1 S1 RNA-binding domain-containing protein [Planctomycetota bacterium]